MEESKEQILFQSIELERCITIDCRSKLAIDLPFYMTAYELSRWVSINYFGWFIVKVFEV